MKRDRTDMCYTRKKRKMWIALRTWSALKIFRVLWLCAYCLIRNITCFGVFIAWWKQEDEIFTDYKFGKAQSDRQRGVLMGPLLITVVSF